VAHRLSRAFGARLHGARERLTRVAAALPASAKQPLRLARLELLYRRDRVVAAPGEILRRGKRETEHRAERLRLLDPFQVMKRGFSLTRDGSGRLLRSVMALAPGDAISSQLADGSVTSRVESVIRGSEDDPSSNNKEGHDGKKG
jgi:exodeoxyribonuclease VII large subunit